MVARDDCLVRRARQRRHGMGGTSREQPQLPSNARGRREGRHRRVEHQGPIDWQRVAGDGIGFVYMKATEGGDWVDATFAPNWAGARAAGLKVGAYHFFTLCRAGADQAANFLRVPLTALHTDHLRFG